MIRAADESMRHVCPYIELGINVGSHGLFNVTAQLIQQHFIDTDMGY
ncbi:hypothetical protein [Paraburkholderia sp. BR10954]